MSRALRQQCEGVIWQFKTGGQWRKMPQEFGAWSTVSNRFRRWRDAGVFETLLEGLIAEAAKLGEVDLCLVSIDSPTRERSPRRRDAPERGRAHRPGQGGHRGGEAQVKRGVAEGQNRRDVETIPTGRSDDASGAAASSG